jgi:hypothetical protein
MGIKFANNAKTTLSASLNNSATTCTVADASVFPTLGTYDYFYMTLEDSSLNTEVVKVTGISSNTLTIARAQDSTSARAFASGDKAELRLPAKALADVTNNEFTDPQVIPDGTIRTLTVKVITKTQRHPYYNVGSTLGFTIDDVESPFIELILGNTYKFDQSDSSNATHPLRLYYDVGKNRAYTTNVTTSGTPGSSGAYTQIVVTEATPRVLFYQCSSHANMGFYLSSATDNNYGFSEVTTSTPGSGANYPTGYVWYVVS